MLLVLAVACTTAARYTVLRFSDNRDESSWLGERRSSLPSTDTTLSVPPIRTSTNDPNASARAMVVYDVQSGYPLYEKNAHDRVPIASTTKLMTAIVTLEHFDLQDTVTVSKEAAAEIGSEMYLTTGEQIRVEDLLKGLLIKSGNDAALALAEHGGIDHFISLMNDTAQRLGLTDTQFRDPAGLNDEGYSSARDLAVIATYALRKEKVQEIVRMERAVVTAVDGSQVHELENSNRLLRVDHPLYFQYATGLKTGFTPAAGHCLVASASQNGNTIVSVVLGTTEETAEASAKESRKLLTWALSSFSWE